MPASTGIISLELHSLHQKSPTKTAIFVNFVCKMTNRINDISENYLAQP